nr:hypothetical protein [Sphingopyxis terrae]
MGGKKVAHVDLLGETAAGKTFERFLEDRCDRLVTDEHFPMAFDLFVSIADAALERVIAVQITRSHPVLDLFRVLAAMMLRDRR